MSKSKYVRPLLSCDKHEVRLRVLGLYKLWARQIPWICRRFDMPKSVQQCKEKLREEFLKHKDLKDVRQIDMLIFIGHANYKETVEVWCQKGHMMTYWGETIEAKPEKFMAKFLDGV